ncbi:hypothetical protein C8R44DRAFT_992826, partial [Mycena epipterygia]
MSGADIDCTIFAWAMKNTRTLRSCHSIALPFWIQYMPRTAPPSSLLLPATSLLFTWQSLRTTLVNTTSPPRPLARTPSLIALLLPTFALFVVISLHVVVY